MINKLTICCLFLLFSLPVFSQDSSTVLFDDGWRFHLGAAQSAQEPLFNDDNWRTIDLPHDWSIEDLPGTHSPFDSTAISQVSGGFTKGGTSWYRKTFTVNSDNKNKRILIQFDGVYMNADVWINGYHLGNHPYGYTSFYYDITDHIKWGGGNVIAVEVKNEGQNSRWYAGSGIYRHVWLQTIAPVHVAQWGTFISTPVVTNTSATVSIKTNIQNETDQSSAVIIKTKIITPNGKMAAVADATQTIINKGSLVYNQNINIQNPQLWSCEAPSLYTAVTEVYTNDKLVDTYKTKFGIRTISFDVANGFKLNGKTMKLKGGCFHIDNGPLGTKAYDRAEIRKVALLKASGFNAIRCSHNPPSPAFLDACDSLGMLVMDETFDMWNYGKNPYDYHLYFKDWWQRDVESMMLRDRNHPSVIMWSIGNEIPEKGIALGAQTAKMLADYVKTFDTTRAVTSAVNDLSDDKDPYFAQLDVGGYNYAIGDNNSKESRYDIDHKRVPNRIMVATESYPLTAFGAWMAVEDHPYVIGDFVWTAWDYIGEASIGWLGYTQTASFYPWNLAFCGDIDICGWKRPQSYYRDALWKKDQLSIFVKPPQPSFAANPEHQEWSKWNWLDAVPEWNWTGNEGKPLEVSVYSSCETAELFLNGKSLGKKQTDRSTQYTAVWQVPYAAGELKAVGYDGSKKINTTSLHTAGEAKTIVLTADKKELSTDNQDLGYITVELKDAIGNTVPQAENEIHFSVEGSATIVGVGNADPMSLESCQSPQRKAWKGRCMVIIKSTGKAGNIVLKASAEGLPETSISFAVK